MDRHHHARRETMTLRNDTALFGWGFMAVWTGMLGVFTWLFWRDNGFHQFHPAVESGILGLFWVFGLGGCAYFFGIPRIVLDLRNGSAVVREQWLLGQRVEECPATSDLAPVLVKGKDSEGDPYFRCTVTTPSGRTVTVAEGHDRERVEAVRARLAAALS